MSTLLSGVPAYRRLHATPTEAFDRLLDALSFVGFGSIERLRNLAASLSDEEGFAWQAARVLSALGHIDLAVDRRTGRLSGWQIAPCCLVQTTDGAWVLAGARSARLIQELESRITHHGGSVSLERPDVGPTVLRAVLPRELGLPDLSEIVTPLGQGIEHVPDFSRVLLAALPPLSAAIPYMPELEVGTGEHQWFDLAHGEWLNRKASAPGAYRVNYRGLNYGFKERPSQTSIRVGDVHLIKHLAAAEARVSLLDHDARREALLVPLGANLPGLCERVAVMCSGVAPRYRADAGLLEYGSVPLEIALSLQQQLHA